MIVRFLVRRQCSWRLLALSGIFSPYFKKVTVFISRSALVDYGFFGTRQVLLWWARYTLSVGSMQRKCDIAHCSWNAIPQGFK